MDATDSIKELRQIVHEILEEAVSSSGDKWMNRAFYGWQVSVWTMDVTVWPPVELAAGQTYIPKIHMSLAKININFEQNVHRIKISIDAPEFTATHAEDLSEPNSILRLGRWLADAMKFTLRDFTFPA